MTKDTNQISMEGYGMIEKTVKGHNSGIGYIYLPKEWIGHEVAVISLTPFLSQDLQEVPETDEK